MSRHFFRGFLYTSPALAGFFWWPSLTSIMNLPFFYKENISASEKLIFLDEETSRHIIQVLRMKKGELVQITDGKGNLITAEISNDHKKKCEVKIVGESFQTSYRKKVAIGISLLKNASRFEWFLEKATEIGVSAIIPLICERTEKQHIRYDRLKNICTSAMLQSQQVWLPDLNQPTPFKSLFGNLPYPYKFIAHCIDGEKSPLRAQNHDDPDSTIILIGPEGDFTNDEVQLAIQHQCIPVSLGETRLRTETAAIVATAILAIR